jgi:hypothetical protein
MCLFFGPIQLACWEVATNANGAYQEGVEIDEEASQYPGTYRLVATDIESGQSDQQNITVTS